MQRYDVFYISKKIGEVIITTEGLFKRIRCKCILPDASIWRLFVKCGDAIIDLGICVPTAAFAVDKRVSGKLLNDDLLHFTIETNIVKNTRSGYDVSEDVPFQNIEKLEFAKFSKENGMPLIYINSEL